MTYEQRVEAYGDVCLKFATLFEIDEAKLEQVVGSALAMEVPISEDPQRFYLQQIYAQYRPMKLSWLFKQTRKAKKDKQFVPSTIKSKRMNAWIQELQQLKVQERAALFARFYLQLEDGAISELMQTPIETIRSSGKNAAAKLERILQKHHLHYIDEGNFKKYFDEDFGSTYNARRRLKQMQAVATIKQGKMKKQMRTMPKWVPIAVACLMFFSSLAIPIAYHQSKKIPFIDVKFIEPSIIWNSTNQPYFQTIHDNYKMYIDHVIYIASMHDFISKQNFDLSTYDEEVARLKEQYEKFDFGLYERDEEVVHQIFEQFNVQYEDYLMREIEFQVKHNIAYEQMTGNQQYELHNYFEQFYEKYEEQIDQLYERFAKYDATNKLSECKMEPYLFIKEADEGVESEEQDYFSTYIPQQSQLCILPNGDVTYMFLDNVMMYFEPFIFELQNELQASYTPYNYHLFYEYFANKGDLTQMEKELMQMTQILAYAYELTYPGLIEPVPALKSEHLIFSN